MISGDEHTCVILHVKCTKEMMFVSSESSTKVARHVCSIAMIFDAAIQLLPIIRSLAPPLLKDRM